MNRRLLRIVTLTTALTDLVIIFVAFALAYYLRYQLQWFRDVDPAYYTTFVPYLPLAAMLTALVMLAFIIEGVYRPRRNATLVDEIYAVINGATTGFVVMVFIVFFWRPLVYSRLIFVYATALIILLLITARVLRRLALASLRRQGAGMDRVLIVGAGEEGLRVLRHLVARPELGYQVVGFVDDDLERGSADIGRIKALGRIDALPDLIQSHDLDEVVITLPSQEHRRILELVETCLRSDVRPRIVPDLFQMSLSRVQVDDVAGIPMLSPHSTELSGWARAFKRFVDIVGSTLGLLVLSPLLALISLAIRLDTPGSPIFRQMRVGRNGRYFPVYKFRSMVQDAEKIRSQLTHLNEADGPLFKIRDDPRTTRVGRFLRRTSLDELPQLWNVLRGDMSLVGPRPALPEEVAGYAEWHRQRLATAPGMTGLWQVSGRSDLPFEEMILLDIYYIENWSPLLDASILMRTVPKVLFRTGAY